MAVDPNPAPQIALSIGTPPQLPLQILALDQAASSLNLSNLDLTPPHLIAQQLIESIPPPPLSDEPPQTASTLNPEVQPAPNTTNAQLQQHLKPLEHASRSKPIPQTPPGTVRRSSQGGSLQTFHLSHVFLYVVQFRSVLFDTEHPDDVCAAYSYNGPITRLQSLASSFPNHIV